MDIAITHCITAGLIPDGKQAAIVPYGKNATLVPMTDGLVMLAHQATKGLSIRTRVVYAQDDWEYEEGLTPIMRHKPNPAADHSDGMVIATYAIARRPGSIDPDFEVMDRATIDRYRGYSRARSGPWDTHYVEMAEKTVLKQLLKRLPKSVQAPPEPPPELEMLGYDLVAPDGLEGVINNPALMPATETASKCQSTPTLPRARSSTNPTRTNRKCRRRPMTTTTRRFRWGVRMPSGTYIGAALGGAAFALAIVALFMSITKVCG